MNKSEIILNGAKELFMRYGIKSITMDDIARDLGISKKTLYQHVENKADLIEQIITDHITNEKECLTLISHESNDAVDEMLQIGRYIVQTLRQMKPTTMFDLKKYYRKSWAKIDDYNIKHVYGIIKNNIEVGIDQGFYREDINPDIIAKLYVGKTIFLADEEMFPMREYNRDALFVEYINYHLHGILSAKGIRQLKKYRGVE